MLLRSILLLTCLYLAACGFTPVHKLQNSDNLSAVKVNTSRGLQEQFFNSHLTDLLNPKAIDTTKKYDLDVTLNITQTALAIQEDRTITRYKIIASARYNLNDKASGKTIASGTIKREGGYDKVESDYATYVSEEDTRRRVTKELAEDLKLRIMSLLVR